MNCERSVRVRLDRIDALDAAGAPPGYLLDELRALAREAAAWVDGEAAWSNRAPGTWSGVEVAPAAEARDAGRLAAARAVTRLHATLEGASIQM